MTDRRSLRRGAKSERRRLLVHVHQLQGQKHTAQTPEDRYGGHRNNPQPGVPGRATNDEQGSEHENSQRGEPGREIAVPTVVLAQWPVEPFLLDEPERPDGEFKICRPTPDSSNNDEDDVVGDASGVPHAVVKGDRHSRGIDENTEGEEPQPKPPLAMVPRKGQLWQQVRIVIIVFLQVLGTSLVFLAPGGSRVVVHFRRFSQGVRETLPTLVGFAFALVLVAQGARMSANGMTEASHRGHLLRHGDNGGVGRASAELMHSRRPGGGLRRDAHGSPDRLGIVRLGGWYGGDDRVGLSREADATVANLGHGDEVLRFGSAQHKTKGAATSRATEWIRLAKSSSREHANDCVGSIGQAVRQRMSFFFCPMLMGREKVGKEEKGRGGS